LVELEKSESIMTKLCTLAEAAALVKDGDSISTSGSLLDLPPQNRSMLSERIFGTLSV
jgi:acyl-CoA hydrolase